MPIGEIVGGIDAAFQYGGLKREQQKARVEQKERQFEYENFDYNQDVGPISDPYSQLAQQQEDYLTQQTDQSAANQLQAQQRAGRFGGTQAIIGAQARAAQQNAQRVGSIRQQGALFVEQQRQARVGQRYDQAETFLARADQRLTAATAAKRRAREKIVSGVAAAATAVVGGVAGGGGLSAIKGGTFDAGAALKGSGLLPAQLQNPLGNISPEQLAALGYKKEG